MPQASTSVLIPSTNESGVVFAPGGKFFVRRVPLAPEGDLAMQIELALEGFSPFPAAQLYYGFRTNAARTEALVYAAYRKNLSAEETATWAEASAVLPSFAVWLGAGVIPAAVVTLREDGDQWEAIAWDGRSELPAAVLVRPKDSVDRDALAVEARSKGGVAAYVPVKAFEGEIDVTREKRELILRLGAGGVEARFDAVALGHADIRDKEVLQVRRQTHRRDTLLWRGFAAILAGLAACVVLELGLFAGRTWLTSRQKVINAQAPEVKKIDQAQSMARRLEEISTQRLLPFEMLNELNNKRPNGLTFSSVSTKGLWVMDIRGQASTADETSTFETQVRGLAGIEKIEVLEKSTRDGVTIFHYEITFKAGWYPAGGGA